MVARAARVRLTDAQRDEAEKYLHLCEFAATAFEKRCRGLYHRDEFFSAAFHGLAKAVRRFDGSRSVPMTAYAPRVIEGACVDMLRAEAGGVIHVPHRKSRPRARHRVVSIDMDAPSGTHGDWADLILPPDPGPPPDAALAAADAFEHLLVGLDAVERFVMRKLYGPAPWTGAAVSRHLGLSDSRVQQLRDTALQHVRTRAFALGLARWEPPAEPGPAAEEGVKVKRRRGPKPPPPELPFDAAELPRHVEGLGPTERRVIELRYGLTGEGPKTPSEIGEAFGFRRNWAWIALRRATAQLEAIHLASLEDLGPPRRIRPGPRRRIRPITKVTQPRSRP